MADRTVQKQGNESPKYQYAMADLIFPLLSEQLGLVPKIEKSEVMGLISLEKQ